MPIPAGARLGSFEVLEPLGAGGMGEVYRARDTRLGREVALKVLPEALSTDRDRLARFEQEARSASALNHPNIVTIHEIGRDGETTFVAMELVDGKTLRELSIPGPMPVKKALHIAAQVSEGLAKAHGVGIVHRDLKPENVMVSTDGFVKILDFGLAKLMETDSSGVSALPTMAQPETRPGTVLGTVGYMSPEQASGEPVDYRSDQFSLGSVLYEMLTGKKPFLRKTAAETMSAIIREEPESATRLRPDLPLPVRWILDRCMAKDRDERYASTRDLARDFAGLRDHLSEATSGGETLQASPPRRRSRLRWIAAGLALAAVAGLAGWIAARSFFAPEPAAPSFRRLTFQRVLLGNARFAPDGQTVVYGANNAMNPTKPATLYLTRLDSPESKPFEFPGDILSISKSADLAIFRAGQSVGYGTLEVVAMTGGRPRSLVENVSWAGADWDPSGKQLAVVRHVDGEDRLEFPVGTVLANGRVMGPRFSPDGREIVYWDFVAEDDSRLTVVDVASRRKTILTAGWPTIAGGLPCWTSDGDEIWFSAARPGEMDSLWAVRRNGALRRVARVPGVLELYDRARDGHILLAHHTLTQTLMGLAPGAASEIDLSWLDHSLPAALSTDGTTVLITEVGEGAGPAPAVYLRTTDGAPAVKIGEGEGVALSPDKQWALTRRAEAGRQRYLLVPTGPGEPRSLPLEGLDVREGAFSPDGKRIVFAAIRGPGARPTVYVADIAAGEPRPIAPEGTSLQPGASPISPDGRRVAGIRAGQFIIFSAEGGGEPRVIPGARPGVDRVIQWSADSRSLYVHRLGNRPVVVELLDPETGSRRPWKQISTDQAPAFQRIRMTPDGTAYVASSRLATSELYLVEGLR